VTRLILALLAIYKRLLSPLLGARCRFEPTCADYARVAVARFGAGPCGALPAASRYAAVASMPCPIRSPCAARAPLRNPTHD